MTFIENVKVSKTLEISIALKFNPYGVGNFLVFVNITNRTRDLVSWSWTMIRNKIYLKLNRKK